MQAGEFLHQLGRQEFAGRHTERTDGHRADTHAYERFPLEHRTEMHRQEARFFIRDGRQAERRFHRVAGGTGRLPDGRVLGLDDRQLRVLHRDALFHAVQHRAQVAAKILRQRRIAAEVNFKRLPDQGDQLGGDIPQLEFVRAAPVVLAGRAAVGFQIQRQAAQLIGWQPDAESLFELCGQTGGAAQADIFPDRGRCPAARPQLLDGQRTVQRQRKEARIAEIKPFRTFKRAQGGPGLSGGLGGEQAGQRQGLPKPQRRGNALGVRRAI